MQESVDVATQVLLGLFDKQDCLTHLLLHSVLVLDQAWCAHLTVGNGCTSLKTNQWEIPRQKYSLKGKLK